jgi:hypothetical protein
MLNYDRACGLSIGFTGYVAHYNLTEWQKNFQLYSIDLQIKKSWVKFPNPLTP